MTLDPKVAPTNAIPAFLETRFDERQFKQIVFSVYYAQNFAHGATGHNDMLIIAKLIDIIREISQQTKQ
jgi:hypothetical protein